MKNKKHLKFLVLDKMATSTSHRTLPSDSIPMSTLAVSCASLFGEIDGYQKCSEINIRMWKTSEYDRRLLYLRWGKASGNVVWSRRGPGVTGGEQIGRELSHGAIFFPSLLQGKKSAVQAQDSGVRSGQK